MRGSFILGDEKEKILLMVLSIKNIKFRSTQTEVQLIKIALIALIAVYNRVPH